MLTLEEIADVVKILEPLETLTREEVWEIVQRNDALIVDGHFDFDGIHSSVLLQFSLIDGDKSTIGRLAQELAVQLTQRGIKGVISYTTTPLDLGTCVARELDVPLIQVQSVYGKPTHLGRGFEGVIRKRKKYLIIQDVSVTGEEVLELISLVKENKAKVAGIGLFAVALEATRSVRQWLGEYGYYGSLFTITHIQGEYYYSQGCPLCKEGKPLQDSREYE